MLADRTAALAPAPATASPKSGNNGKMRKSKSTAGSSSKKGHDDCSAAERNNNMEVYLFARDAVRNAKQYPWFDVKDKKT